MKSYSAVTYEKTKIKVFDTTTGQQLAVINTGYTLLNQPIINNDVVSVLCQISIGRVQNRVYKVPSGTFVRAIDI